MFLSVHSILYTALSNRNLIPFTIIVILKSISLQNSLINVSWNWGKGMNTAYSSPAGRGAGRLCSACYKVDSFTGFVDSSLVPY